MKEPVNPHFVLSDGNYCHFLDDRLVIGKCDLPAKLPEPVNKTNMLVIGLLAAAIVVLLFFLVMTILVSFYIVTFTIACLLVLSFVTIFRGVKYSNTPAIMKADIIKAQYHKRAFGYDFFTLIYAGEGGKLWARRLAIYDSQQALDQALQVMKEQRILQ